MYVTKVVDLFAKIPEQLSLYFSDFLQILNEFTSSLEKLENKKNTDCKGAPGTFTKPPRNLKLIAQGSLAGVGDRGGGGGPFPGEEGLAGGGGGVLGARAHRDLPRGG